jgi:hypothetical protein
MKKLFTFALYFTSILLITSCSSSTDTEEEPLPIEPAGPELIHYWHFDVMVPNDTELESISATYTSINNLGNIRFQSSMSDYPNTERIASLERRNRPTIINYRPEGNFGISFLEAADSMRAIQVKEPFIGDAGENTLFLDLPTTGRERAVLTFAAINENAALNEPAANNLRFDYSIASGTTQWITAGLKNDQIVQELIDQYLPMEVDFSGIDGVNNNPNFKVRIRFGVSDGTKNLGDRVTFNNFALDAAPIRN